MTYIPVVFCFDRNYVDPVTVSTYSVFKTSKSKIKFYWICYNSVIPHAEFYRKSLSKIGIDIDIIGVHDNVFDNWKKDLIVPHVTAAAYLRILIPALIKELKIIYLDCDTICMQDISELFAYDISDVSLAGVDNFLSAIDIKVNPPIIDSKSVYINSGVMLMNLKKMRENDSIEKMKHIHDIYYDCILAGDQCIINKYAEYDKRLLDISWNYMVKNTRISDIDFLSLLKNKNVKIIHFTDSSKPWNILTYGEEMRNFWFDIAKNMKNELKNSGSLIF